MDKNLFKYLLSFLKPKQLIQCSLVSKYWCECSRDEATWKRHKDRILRVYPKLSTIFTGRDTWFCFKEYLFGNVETKAIGEANVHLSLISPQTGPHCCVFLYVLEKISAQVTECFSVKTSFDNHSRTHFVHFTFVIRNLRKGFMYPMGCDCLMFYGCCKMDEFFVSFRNLVCDKEHKTPPNFDQELAQRILKVL